MIEKEKCECELGLCKDPYKIIICKNLIKTMNVIPFMEKYFLDKNYNLTEKMCDKLEKKQTLNLITSCLHLTENDRENQYFWLVMFIEVIKNSKTFLSKNDKFKKVFLEKIDECKTLIGFNEYLQKINIPENYFDFTIQ